MTARERWAPIAGYEGIYEVSDLGRVRGVDRIDARGRRWRGRIRSLSAGSGGYLQVTLYRDGGSRTARVHTLVLSAFVSPRPEGLEGCHNDGNRANARLGNLRWGTFESNESDKERHGTIRRGAAHPQARIAGTDVERVKDLRRYGYTQRQIGDWLGVSNQHVSNILRGQHWSQGA